MAKRKDKKNKPTRSKNKLKSTASGLKGQPIWFTNVRLHIGVIFLLTFLFYANTIGHDYTQDDAIVIYDNEFTTQGLSGIPGILTYDTFRGFFKVEGKDKLVAGGRYRPLTLMMYALEVQLFAPKKLDVNGKPVLGKSGNTVYDPYQDGKPNLVKKVGHLMNILWYGLAAVLVYLIFLQLGTRGNWRNRKTSFWVENEAHIYFLALTTALLFALHPVHTEVVANIKGRDEIMTLVGSLAALYFSLRAYYENNPVFQVVTGIFFFLGLLAKENAITFLAIAPFTYYFFTKASPKKIVLQSLPFLAAAAVFLIIRTAILDFSLGTTTTELMNNPFVKVEGNQYIPFTFAEKMSTIFYTLGKYIQLLIFPYPLTHDYYPRHIGVLSFANWKVLLSLITYLGLIVYAIRGTFKKDPVAYGILFFIATISIASNIVFPIGTNMSERFAFMPSIGFTVIVAVLLYRLAKMLAPDKSITKFEDLNKSLMIVAAISLVFGIGTFTRNQAWKDNFTLFTTDIKTSPNSAKLRNAVGGELTTQSLKEKNENKRQSMLVEAEGHLVEALKIHPNYKNAYLQLGNINNYLQRYEQSIDYYNKALQLDPNYQDATNNIGITYRMAGEFYGKEKGDTRKAIQYLEKAYEYNSVDFETAHSLGVAYGISGNTQKAIQLFSQAVQLQPDNVSALNNLASAHGMSGNDMKAIETFERIIQLEPNNANALFNLGTAYAKAGNAEKAQEYQQRAIQINPSLGQ